MNRTMDLRFHFSLFDWLVVILARLVGFR